MPDDKQTTDVVPSVIDAAHLAGQRAWSRETFGPGTRLLGVLDHIRKELREIQASPGDVEEWVDVIILAFDGAWRAGWEPQEIIDAIKAKQAKNEARTWPDWRTASPDAAIEHVRGCGLHAWGADHTCVTCGAPEPHVRPRNTPVQTSGVGADTGEAGCLPSPPSPRGGPPPRPTPEPGVPPGQCDNYRPPQTCLTAPSSETGRCDHCRDNTPGLDGRP